MTSEVTLAQCPIGLFWAGDELCLKTEYGNNEGRIDAYIVSTGEFFWGSHPQTIPNQRMQMVRPVPEEAISRLTAQSGEGRSGAGEDALREAAFALAISAGALVIATDGQTNIRCERKKVLRDLAKVEAVLNARQSSEGEQDGSRIIKAWLDWYRFATGDDDCQYLNGKGWDDAEALASTSMGYLAALRATDDAGGVAKAPDTGEGE